MEELELPKKEIVAEHKRLPKLLCLAARALPPSKAKLKARLLAVAHKQHEEGEEYQSGKFDESFREDGFREDVEQPSKTWKVAKNAVKGAVFAPAAGFTGLMADDLHHFYTTLPATQGATKRLGSAVKLTMSSGAGGGRALQFARHMPSAYGALAVGGAALGAGYGAYKAMTEADAPRRSTSSRLRKVAWETGKGVVGGAIAAPVAYHAGLETLGRWRGVSPSTRMKKHGEAYHAIDPIAALGGSMVGGLRGVYKGFTESNPHHRLHRILEARRLLEMNPLNATQRATVVAKGMPALRRAAADPKLMLRRSEEVMARKKKKAFGEFSREVADRYKPKESEHSFLHMIIEAGREAEKKAATPTPTLSHAPSFMKFKAKEYLGLPHQVQSQLTPVWDAASETFAVNPQKYLHAHTSHQKSILMAKRMAQGLGLTVSEGTPSAARESLVWAAMGLREAAGAKGLFKGVSAMGGEAGREARLKAMRVATKLPQKTVRNPAELLARAKNRESSINTLMNLREGNLREFASYLPEFALGTGVGAYRTDRNKNYEVRPGRSMRAGILAGGVLGGLAGNVFSMGHPVGIIGGAGLGALSGAGSALAYNAGKYVGNFGMRRYHGVKPGNSKQKD